MRFLTILLARDGVVLTLILVLAAALRLYHLGSNPPGLFCDEASIANNAASLGQTGRDLDGQLLPLHPCDPSYEAWGFPGGIVYKPLFSYAMVPWLRLVPRTPALVRVPSVAFGLLGIAGLFLLARHLYGREIALTAALLLALLPWHHQFSRIAFEAISIVPTIAFGLYFLFRGLQGPRLLALGSGITCLAAYAYPTGSLYAPLLLAGFFWTQRASLRGRGRAVAAALGVAAFLALPIILPVLGNVHQERARSLFIGSADLRNESAVIFLRERSSDGSLAAAILHHRALLLPWVFAVNYFSYFSPNFLFLSGDSNFRHSLIGMGMGLPYLAPLLLVGIGALWESRKDPTRRFLLFFLLVFPVPASLAIGSPHAIRSLPGALILTLIAAVGAERLRVAVLPTLKDRANASWASQVVAVGAGAVFLLVPVQTLQFLYHYHHDYAVYSAPAWEHGLHDAIVWLEREKAGYRNVYLSPEIFNSNAAVLFAADVDYRTLPRGRDIAARLGPLQYRILFGGEAGDRAGRNLWLFPASERARYAGLEVLREFPFPDGSPHLVAARSGG